MVYVAKEFVDAVLAVPIIRLARELHLRRDRVRALRECGRKPGRAGAIKLEVFQKVCDYLTAHGKAFSVSGIFVHQPELPFVCALDEVQVFLGGKTTGLHGATQPAANAHVSVADVRALLALLEVLRSEFSIEANRVHLDLAMAQQMGAVQKRFQAAAHTALRCVVGSALVNALFTEAYDEISAFFNRRRRTIIFHWRDTPTNRDLLSYLDPADAKRFCHLTSSEGELGVSWSRGDVGSTNRIPRNEAVDAAVVMASRNNLILCGHGARGTRASVELFSKHWKTIDEHVRRRDACILIGTVSSPSAGKVESVPLGQVPKVELKVGLAPGRKVWFPERQRRRRSTAVRKGAPGVTRGG